ncbi:ComEC/Rec2 family competence protein [Microbacterium sp.]|uniref:ComEC/Rec2 family competence protein n=1 Tax=Microbacterium sp. TaxID=51671 RepID=UPI000C4E612C|nr:ComEC/Rec2 family competence protein [Microbacterium sp.]MBU20088.1 competence protein ComEC [Microbacterium sp.]
MLSGGRRWRAARLVPAAVVAWATAFVLVNAPALAPMAVMALAAAGVGGGVVLGAISRPRSSTVAAEAGGGYRRAPGTVGILSVVVVAVAAGAAVGIHVALAQPGRDAALEAFGSGSRVVEVEAIVSGKVEPRAGGQRAFDASIRLIGADGGAISGWTDAAVRVSGEQVSSGLDVGARARMNGTSRPAYPGDRAVVQILAHEIEVVEPPTGILRIAADLRQSLVRAAAGLPGGGGELVPGLAVGDTSAVSSQTDADMKASSLSHLTAVSGANCALVVGIAFVVAAGLGAGRRVRVVSGLGALVGFVILVTPEPSVVRAAMMAGIAMLAVLLGRAGAGGALLSAAVVLLLLFDPWLAGSLGFALSVAATAALLTLARPLASGLTRAMPAPLALALSVPLAAQLACGPLLVLIDPTVPLWGVPANLLAAPAAPAATVLGLAACLAAPFPVLQSGLAALAWLPAAWIAGIADVASGLPFARVPWVSGLVGALSLAVVGGLVALALGLPAQSPRSARIRRGSALLLAALVTVWTSTTVVTTITQRWGIPGEWSILMCDVGQGDAVLVRSEGATALIDTGHDPALVSACLDRVGVTRLDLLVLTHFDKDHVGGTEAVIGRAETVLHGPTDGSADERLLEELAAAGAQVVSGQAGMTGTLGGAHWSVLWPRATALFAAGNDSSVTVSIEGGGVPRSLFLGDLSADPQRMLRASVSGVVEVVKVSHHGSADQDPGLYEQIAPRVALIGVGADNTYGHPTTTTIAMLQGSAVGRTDQDGIVAVVGEGDTLALWRERAASVVGGG